MKKQPEHVTREDAHAVGDDRLRGIFRTHGIVLPPLRRRFGRYRSRDVDAMLEDLAVQVQRWESTQETALHSRVADMVLAARRDVDRLAREARETVGSAERELARIKSMIEDLAWLPPIPPERG